jgi:hypothetical protein
MTYHEPFTACLHSAPTPRCWGSLIGCGGVHWKTACLD